jgi:hypothetical protein
MYLEEKIIASGLMFIFAVVVWHTSHPKGMRGLANPSHWWWLGPNFLFKKNGTEKKYTKLFFSLIFVLWGISFWLFPDFWSHRN